MVTPRERGRYQAYMGAVWVTSGVAGPVLGGVLAEHLHWSLIFWLNVPLGLGAALLTHSRPQARCRATSRRHKLDLLGAAPVMASAIPLLLALTMGGTRSPWVSPRSSADRRLVPAVARCSAGGSRARPSRSCR